eukprot:1380501-Amorphochlora_amoeboformis.AAC.1
MYVLRAFEGYKVKEKGHVSILATVLLVSDFPPPRRLRGGEGIGENRVFIGSCFDRVLVQIFRSKDGNGDADIDQSKTKKGDRRSRKKSKRLSRSPSPKSEKRKRK